MNAFSGRIHILNKRSMDKNGHYVLYWMQQSQRAVNNHALEYAIQTANEYGKPLIAVFIINPRFPESNIRHMQFMIEGLRDTARMLNERNITLIVKIDSTDTALTELASQSCCIVSDMGYLRYQRIWRKHISDKAGKFFILVEGDTVVPVETASDKEEYGAYTIRRKINAVRHSFLQLPRQAAIKHRIDIQTPSADLNNMDMSMFDNGISVVSTRGGYREAIKKLENFLDNDIHHYAKRGNYPAMDVHSHLSPYIHFGQISVIEIALAVNKCSASYDVKEAFLEQLIVRRELAANFVYYNKYYDSLRCLPQWVQNTLNKHAEDKREHKYSISRLEQADTHDDIWNKAQKHMSEKGTMHNYLRMYWGKKIIEWTDDYAEALKAMIYLNNRYQLDGRDINSYAGILWCLGKHDRAFKEREVLGKLRYMSYDGVKRKMRIQ